MHTRKNISWAMLFVICCFTFQVSALAAGQQDASLKSFLWKVKSDTSTAYILGSIHFADETFYPLNETIENAFNDSSLLVVEINPFTLDEQEMTRIIMEKGMYRGEETLVDNIDKETLAMLQDHAKKNALPLQNFMKMKPAVLGLTLSTLQIVKMGYSPEEGIDNYFCNKAKGKKEIAELETMEDQLALFLDIPDGDLFLKYTLIDLENLEKIFTDLVGFWKRGDHAGMDEVLFKPYGDSSELFPILDRVFYKRNVNMAAKIKEMLKGKETFFVVVGAGHLVGEKGIIQLLKNEQYALQQL